VTDYALLWNYPLAAVENAISIGIHLVLGVYQMDTEAFVQGMFEVDSSIRYIAIVDSKYHILTSEHRDGIIPLTTQETDRNFISIIPQIIVEAVEKLSPFLGPVGGITAHYQKALLIFYRFEDLLVIISFNPEQETPFYNRLIEAFRKLSTQHLT